MGTEPEFGLELIEAAQDAGVTIRREAGPGSGHFDSDGLRLHYLDWIPVTAPDRELPLLCLHGFAQNAHMWDFVALALAHNRRLIALDQRGHGDSQWAGDGDYSLEAGHRDVAELLRHLDLPEVLLMGLSMGGMNAFTYAGRYPDQVRGLVVVDVGPEPSGGGGRRIRAFVEQDDVLDSFDTFVQRTLRYSPRRAERQVRGSLRHQLREREDGKWTWKYDPILRSPHAAALRSVSIEQRWQWWKSIQCPTLIIRGEESDILSRELSARMLAEHAASATLVEVANAGHLVPGDNPVGFERALTPFLNAFP